MYEELAEMHSAQPKNDMLPALDVLKEYLGMLGEFPDAQHLMKACLGSQCVTYISTVSLVIVEGADCVLH